MFRHTTWKGDVSIGSEALLYRTYAYGLRIASAQRLNGSRHHPVWQLAGHLIRATECPFLFLHDRIRFVSRSGTGAPLLLRDAFATTRVTGRAIPQPPFAGGGTA